MKIQSRLRCRITVPNRKRVHFDQPGDDDVIQSTKLLRIILDTLYDYVNKSKIGSLNSHSHWFKSFNTNLHLLEQQRKNILEDAEKQGEAKNLLESDIEEEIKKI
ncbi:unnamed protein product [Rotaria magnacalcarata]|uniref:Uncharacterized protein n=1 Tax=Rotaria magnacalcarata TaxID=392030 RepID=A0A8S2LGQ4_9BILA|nr:unnamed protein product [Rotaria magnacalcarata]